MTSKFLRLISYSLASLQAKTDVGFLQNMNTHLALPWLSDP